MPRESAAMWLRRQDAMDEAGETPENMDALKAVVMEKLGEWYMRNHGVGTMANVEDMCTLLQVPGVCGDVEGGSGVHALCWCSRRSVCCFFV